MSKCEERSHRRIPKQPLWHGISLKQIHNTLQDLDNPSATGAIVAAGAVSAVRAMLEQNMRMHVILLAITPRGERCGPLTAHFSAHMPTSVTCPHFHVLLRASISRALAHHQLFLLCSLTCTCGTLHARHTPYQPAL